MRVTERQAGRRLSGPDDIDDGGGGAGVAGTAAHDDFTRFVSREWRPLVAFGWSLTGDSVAAEDLAQEALEAAWRHWQRVGGYERPGAWARRVVASRATDRGRRHGRETRALQRLSGDPAPEVALEPVDARFWEAVRALPDRQAQAVALRYLEDMAVADIADVLAISEGAVKTHLHRGRLALAQQLGLLDADDEETER